MLYRINELRGVRGTPDAEPLRAEYGCTGKQIYRDPDAANDLFITHDFPTVDQATAFANDPKLKTAMQNAGVTSAPRIEIFEVV